MFCRGRARDDGVGTLRLVLKLGEPHRQCEEPGAIAMGILKGYTQELDLTAFYMVGVRAFHTCRRRAEPIPCHAAKEDTYHWCVLRRHAARVCMWQAVARREKRREGL